MVISGLIAKLDANTSATASVGSGAEFSVFTAPSSGDEEGKLLESAADPLEELDLLGGGPPAHTAADGDNANFLCALEELSGHFHEEEEKGEPLSEWPGYYHERQLAAQTICRWCEGYMWKNKTLQ
ncbi:hypothetical protein E2C01_050337 [Portunus trituberculatus]|uniref:Uncharacterized protein n=1 Tax=Portunus trituberculatus TaxID=210409 RepID=A0A5B7GGH3_PORTR|nr:hypothetical protein [Portunus trituberculatus]